MKSADIVPKAYLDALQDRAADAENCVRRLLNHINPRILEITAGDWKAATEAVCDE
jgi:hypothetical protein